MPENANRLLKLIGLERFLQNRDRPLGQNPVEHFAIGITRNNNDWALGLFPLGLIVNVVSRAVRQFQIEKNEVELLFVERGQRFFDRSNYHAAESDLLKKKFEEILQTLVVVDHEHGGLAGFVLLENVFVEGGLFDSPASTDLNSWNLTIGSISLPFVEILNIIEAVLIFVFFIYMTRRLRPKTPSLLSPEEKADPSRPARVAVDA